MRSFLAFLISSLLLLVIDFLGWSRPAKAWMAGRTSPIQQAVYQKITNYKLQITNFGQSAGKIVELEQIIGELERENAELIIENEQLKIENANSRRLLAVPLPSEWSFLTANVLGKTRYLLIDKGQRDGVTQGMVVIFENVLVGQVAEVGEKTAKILLVTDEKSKIQVKTGSVKGILVGTGDGLLLTQVPQAEKFETESLVVTSGSEEVFPPNLLIGKVASISQDERQPFQQAEIEPLVDSANLQTVFLIL